MSRWLKKSKLSHLKSHRSHISRSRFLRQNSGLNEDELKQLDPDIFYSTRKYLKEIEEKGQTLEQYRIPLPKNYFYNFIKKYIEENKKLSNSEIPLEIRRENVKKSIDMISRIDKIFADNTLLNERPILSIMLHGEFMNSRDFKMNWIDSTKQQSKWMESTPLKVDVIYISNAVLGDITYFMNVDEKDEYTKIIIDLKYTSFLNKTLQKKQIDVVTERLRVFYNKIFENRIQRYEKEKHEIEKLEQDVERYVIMEKKLLTAGVKPPGDMEEYNNQRKQQIENYKNQAETPEMKAMKDYKRIVHNKRNKFQVYYLKKGFKINKVLVQDKTPVPQGIFDSDDNEFFFEYRIDEHTKKQDTFRIGNDVYVSMDKFINYYYDYCMERKPKSIIIIDNSCGVFKDNHKYANKETANKMRKIFTNKQSTAKRSLNRSKMSLGKKHKSFSLNMNKPVKHIASLKRSTPLTNKEITNIQQDERQRQQKIMNDVEIQKELNKMKVKSHSRRSRSKPLSTYPHEDVHEQLQKSLSKGSKPHTLGRGEETKINE